MRHYIFLILLCCLTLPGWAQSEETRIAAQLNDFHKQASLAQGAAYFAHFAPDGIFIGTDISERWTVEQFKAYAMPFFDKGQGWTYRPLQRHIYLSADGRTAWFDETLESQNYGATRGTGVLVKLDGNWKIRQYHLTVPIPNDLLPTVVEMLQKAKPAAPIVLNSDLEVEKLSEHLYLHRSWLQTESFGRVPCNGLIYVSGKEALVIDAPTTEALSERLIDWVQANLGVKVTGLVVGHFHGDSLGGLAAFQRAGANSYSSRRTQEIARKKGLPVPDTGFDSQLEIEVGTQHVVCGYFGAGHTVDNVVTYLPQERVLFGGCLIKALDSAKGNLEDADVGAWSATVRKVSEAFPDAKLVVPGHGDSGDRELLRYTIDLFQ